MIQATSIIRLLYREQQVDIGVSTLKLRSRAIHFLNTIVHENRCFT